MTNLVESQEEKWIDKELAIQTIKLSFKYPQNEHYSVKELSLNIKQGFCTGIIGPNGAGKSTLISLLCGLLKPSEGSINYYPHINPDSERETESKSQTKLLTTADSLQKNIKKYVALIPQEYAFYPELTVKQNLQYFIALSEKSASKRQSLLITSLKDCQLDEVAKQKSGSLSGGYKRRLNIAIALSKSPQIIFLDEPTVGIDPVSRQEIISLLVRLKKQGNTLIYTSHMLNEVEQLCDDIILLEQGSAIAISDQSNEHMQINFELVNNSANAKDNANLLNQLGLTISKQGQTSYQLEIKNLQHLQDSMRIFSQDMGQIKSLHFAQNSLEQLYFNSYKASAC